MIKKLILIFIVSIFILLNQTAVQAAKITNINFDNSDNIMFIGTNGHEFDCSSLKITPVKLQDPDRVYFDIPNATLTSGAQSWMFKNTAIQQIKVAQFSVNPDIVRFVIYHNRNFNTNDINFYCTANNALTVAFSDNYNAKNNSISTYRSQNTLSSDFYDKTVYATEDKVQKISNNLAEAPSNSNNTDALAKIQQAIDMHTTTSTEPFNLILDRNFVLQSNFFVNKIDVKRGNVLLSGIGNAEIENPFTLENPTRLVIALPNTIIAPHLRNKEYSLSPTDSFKIGQFEPSKARIVITTPTPEQYLALMSFDTQSLFIANENRLYGLKFSDRNAQLVALKSYSNSDTAEEFHFNFNNTVIPAIKRTSSNFELSIFNIENYDIEALRRAAKYTKLQPLKIEKFSQNCIKFVFPVKKTTAINLYQSVNDKQFALKFVYEKAKTEIIPAVIAPIKDIIISKKDADEKVIVIDAGHGGNDVGALKNQVCEKNINLPVALKTAEILRKKGFNVYLTREDDSTLTLQDRVDFTQSHEADIFVSIHANSCAKPEISGIETHYYKNIDFELAKSIHASLTRYLSTADRGLFKSKFYVINHNDIPAVLLEIGFMTNPSELASMQTEKRQNDTAKAIAEGIINYLTRK